MFQPPVLLVDSRDVDEMVPKRYGHYHPPIRNTQTLSQTPRSTVVGTQTGYIKMAVLKGFQPYSFPTANLH